MMEKESMTRYQPPVASLLTYGESERLPPEQWPDYQELGIGREQIPELIQMATDEELNDADTEKTEVWAPLHAWRTLGQLRAVEAVEPLLELFNRLEDDDWVHEELPDVFSLIGPAVLPQLRAYLADLSHDEYSQGSVIHSIEEIGKRWPDAREESIAILTERLERFEENDPGVNGFLVAAMLDLRATEAAPVIKRAFDEGSVDWMVAGDWNDVQVELGLKTPEEVAPRQANDWRAPVSPSPPAQTPDHSASSQVAHKDKGAQKKAKSKMAKLSRKKNRKR